MTLPPGAATMVKIKLLVGQKFGEVVHETEVVTVPPAPGGLVLRTAARAYAPLRIEEDPATSSAGDRPYRIFATGTPSEPAVDLDRLDLDATIPAHWSGPSRPIAGEDGVAVACREFVVSCDPTGKPGSRTAVLRFLRDGEVLDRLDLRWEVEPPLVPTPRMVVLTAATREFRVAVRSSDRKPFRITRIESATPGVTVASQEGPAAALQGIVVKVDPERPLAANPTAIRVFTDHPAQHEFELPLMIVR